MQINAFVENKNQIRKEKTKKYKKKEKYVDRLKTFYIKKIRLDLKRNI